MSSVNIWTCLIPIPPPPAPNQQHHNHTSCEKQQPSSHWMGKLEFGAPQILQPERIVTIWLVQQLRGKASFTGLAFSWSQSLFRYFVWDTSSAEHLPKIIIGNCLKSHLPHVVIPIEKIRGWSKNLNLVNEISIGSFEKLWHISGDLEDHTHVQDCVHSPSKDLWNLQSLTSGWSWDSAQAGNEVFRQSPEDVPQHTQNTS